MFVIYTEDNRGTVVRHYLCNGVETVHKRLKDLATKYPGRRTGFVKVWA